MKDKFYSFCSKVLESLIRAYDANLHGFLVLLFQTFIGYGLCKLSLNGFEWQTFVALLTLCISELIQIGLLGHALKDYFVKKSKIKNITVCYYANDGKQYHGDSPKRFQPPRGFGRVVYLMDELMEYINNYYCE